MSEQYEVITLDRRARKAPPRSQPAAKEVGITRQALVLSAGLVRELEERDEIPKRYTITIVPALNRVTLIPGNDDPRAFKVTRAFSSYRVSCTRLTKETDIKPGSYAATVNADGTIDIDTAEAVRLYG